MDGVHDAAALELNPYTVGAGARERDVELNLDTSIRDERMCVRHVD